MTGDTPVKDMALALYWRIKEYGGAKAIFDQLDPRFKSTEVKKTEGIKSREFDKITFKSFEKSFERLSKGQKNAEKMSFGIRGNPLLLANVFKVLGISGFEDLTKTTFVEPDPKGKLFAIDNKVDGLMEKLDSLDEKLDAHMRKRSRITVLKAAADFDSITKTLSGILETNTDLLICSIAAGTYMNYLKKTMGIMNSNNRGEITNIIQFQKHIRLLRKAEEENTFLNSLSKKIISKQAGEAQKVLHFYWIIYEHGDYCFFLHSLRGYRRFMTKYIDDLGLSDDSNLYTMSPLYVSLLYLTITLQYIKKVADNSNVNLNKIHEKSIIKKIEDMGIRRLGKNHIATKPKYYETMTLKLINNISKIIKHFALHEISSQPKLFEKCNDILAKIVPLYKKALVDTKNSMETENCGNGIKTLGGLFSAGLIGVCGLFRLDSEIMDDFDILLNEVSVLATNTMRDSHGK